MIGCLFHCGNQKMCIQLQPTLILLATVAKGCRRGQPDFNGHVNMPLKCLLKTFQIRGRSSGIFTWPVASKASQLLVSCPQMPSQLDINIPFVWINCFPITLIEKLLSATLFNCPFTCKGCALLTN